MKQEKEHLDSQVPGLTDLNPGLEESVLFFQWEQSDLLVNGVDYLLERIAIPR